MTSINTIKKILESNILLPELIIIPGYGATEGEIHEEEIRLGRELRSEHIAILRQWNGIALDVIRFFGCGASTGKIGRLCDFQIPINFDVLGAIVVGSDASGFVYVQSGDGLIFSLDTDGGKFKMLAKNLDDFIGRVVFGPDADSFAGEDWLNELREAGVV